MDRKSILVLVLCFILLMLWPALVNKIYPPPKSGAGRTNLVFGAGSSQAVDLANLPSGTNAMAGGDGGARATVMTASRPGVPVWSPPEGPEQVVRLESPEAVYTFTSHGGGLKTVELKGKLETVPCGRGKSVSGDTLAALNRGAPVPALAFFGGGVLEDARPFALEQSGSVVRAEKALTNGLRIVKEFQVHSNHVVAATVRVENHGSVSVDLPAQEWVIGAATPMGPYDDGTYVRVEWYDGGRTVSADRGWFANRSFFGCLPGSPRLEYQSPGVSNVVWASVQNQFFTMVAVPQQTAFGLVARPVDLPPPADADQALDKRLNAKPVGYQTALVYAPLAIPPGQALERQVEVFAGPKEYNALAKLGRNVDLVMGFGGFFGWFAKLLLTSMNGLHGLGLSYGLTIIAITVIIKLLFWPLTQASTRSMKRMQALQPQMKALQEKYKGDPKKMNQKLMEFMKENRRQPAWRLPADAAADSGFLWVLPDAAQRDRTARRSFSLGLRPVAAGHGGVDLRVPPQSVAADHGRDSALANASDAAVAWGGSGATEDDAIHAVDLRLHALQFLGRAGALLDGAESAQHSADETHQDRGPGACGDVGEAGCAWQVTI